MGYKEDINTSPNTQKLTLNTEKNIPSTDPNRYGLNENHQK